MLSAPSARSNELALLAVTKDRAQCWPAMFETERSFVRMTQSRKTTAKINRADGSLTTRRRGVQLAEPSAR